MSIVIYPIVIYPICRPLIATALFASATIFAAGCSQSTQTLGTANNPEAAAETLTQSPSALADSPAEQQPNQGVRTTHDVFHSRTIEVPAGTPVPAVTVRVEEDEIEGWNLYVGTANFTFEPSKVNGESSPTAGHGHLYINDKPIQRIYGTWTHLPTLPGGENKIRVTLNANSFETLTTQNQPIEDSVVVDVYDPIATE